MITKEKYLEALDIVETYHQQLRQSSFVRNLDWDNLKAGDYIVFDKTMSKWVTIGQKYKVIEVSKDWNTRRFSVFYFFDDKKRRKQLRKYAQGYSMRIAEIATN